ncbi:MAG: Arc family DNA binding domain-containing protein [bacterium]|nr:Arc family DNA binding domain-containing protein [bacterium]
MSTKKSILLRVDPKLWASLNRWAKDELRSLNGQIEYVLRESVKKREKRKSDSDDDII